MTDVKQIQSIVTNPHFMLLRHKRNRFAWSMAAIMLAVYAVFILLIAFDPQWLGTPLYEGATITRGIPLGVGIIVLSFILTAIYVFRANREFDRLVQQLSSEVTS
ncbi:MAG: DUF485 domain-containing protein [Enterobacteriaceae bacterium]